MVPSEEKKKKTVLYYRTRKREGADRVDLTALLKYLCNSPSYFQEALLPFPLMSTQTLTP